LLKGRITTISQPIGEVIISYFHKGPNFFNHEPCSNKIIFLKMEQILEEELEALNVGYQERTTKEMLPS
jgi:hypothetical protein